MRVAFLSLAALLWVSGARAADVEVLTPSHDLTWKTVAVKHGHQITYTLGIGSGAFHGRQRPARSTPHSQ
jgi:hypothetical protein